MWHRIYLSGGGICGVAHVGALQALDRLTSLHAIKEWMGVSAGALTALCLTIGFTLDELADFSLRFDFTHIQEPDTPTGWILHMGMDTGERLLRLIHACLHVKGYTDTLTFKELYDATGLTLRVLATDLNEATGRVFSPTDSPHYPVAVAVCASMTYPYYFQPIICPETGHHLIDGGVTSNYPLYLLPKEEHPRTLALLLRLGISTTDDITTLPPEQRLIRPLSVALTEKTNIETTLYDTECIRIPIDDVNVLDFALSEEAKHLLVERGRRAVDTWWTQRPKPARRHSF
jgi:predicted acylesterase/phospholipase RssA